VPQRHIPFGPDLYDLGELGDREARIVIVVGSEKVGISRSIRALSGAVCNVDLGVALGVAVDELPPPQPESSKTPTSARPTSGPPWRRVSGGGNGDGWVREPYMGIPPAAPAIRRGAVTMRRAR